MFDLIKRFCIALVLAVFIGALFLGASTAKIVGADGINFKAKVHEDDQHLHVLH